MHLPDVIFSLAAVAVCAALPTEQPYDMNSRPGNVPFMTASQTNPIDVTKLDPCIQQCVREQKTADYDLENQTPQEICTSAKGIDGFVGWWIDTVLPKCIDPKCPQGTSSILTGINGFKEDMYTACETIKPEPLDPNDSDDENGYSDHESRDSDHEGEDHQWAQALRHPCGGFGCVGDDDWEEPTTTDGH